MYVHPELEQKRSKDVKIIENTWSIGTSACFTIDIEWYWNLQHLQEMYPECDWL
jgi:hypothetical protein